MKSFSCAPFIPDPENITLIDMARDLYMHFGKNIEALRCAMRTNNTSAIEKIFGSTTDGYLFISWEHLVIPNAEIPN